MVITDPAAGAEAQDDLARQAAGRTEINVLQRRRIAQLRVAQALRQFPRLAGGPFGVDEQAEAVVETELRVLTRAPLGLKRRGHRRQV